MTIWLAFFPLSLLANGPPPTLFGLSEWLLDGSDGERLTYLVPREDTVVLAAPPRSAVIV